MTDPTQALSFGAAAAAYDRFRPRYPEEALRWALDGLAPPARVVDLGAGTGILSRGVLGLGHQVVPVEPDPGMRAQLTVATPGTTALAGSAESVPLPAGSADAVLVGQAYHWFDREPAHAEIARVLRTGGTFAPIWNTRDERVDWVAELGRVAHLGDNAGDVTEKYGDFGPAFEPIELGEFEHSTTLTPDDLIGMLHTRSYWLTATPEGRDRIDRGLRDLFANHPDLAGRETVDLPYRTIVLRTRRRVAR
ncbi:MULTISPECIES: class I SAM-dependent methyltransferase [Micromonospora]|uniref:Class I SAM-dependent methyltransferase n=1 Tax=Micromonospora solifontis TaxID=2487138 RepID=A0ABX9WKN8_9ACTN|nr:MULTISPECIES: class I SAM-dependent methyltransferase [Micromonospora]NES14685.1 class I SAM-dependent methyltransferase [Micromonospora sp. PPF5-17B]NES36667.1 class I SAM-dependent methyltransferase [Micromonospora solifontis]NES55693.1 class I SAM-dependent methyltransferase [Micromonospora sp. PPF5-6]RNL99258.1 class I SAM-dependent methyltransferase [Micromonospora solifontis]